MRIAVSGSHATGKTTLIAELARRLDGYDVLDEPYYTLEEEGHAFEHPPSADDFELLFRRSVSLLETQRARHVLFDRSPADYLAYRAALDPTADLSAWVTDTAAALATLDLIVFAPIEARDRIQAAESPRLRRRVHRLLHEMFVDRSWGFDVPVIAVSGTPNERAEQVQAVLTTPS